VGRIGTGVVGRPGNLKNEQVKGVGGQIDLAKEPRGNQTDNTGQEGGLVKRTLREKRETPWHKPLTGPHWKESYQTVKG